ncbi:ABC transporter permease subunit [Pantoea ananatis]|uniref:ABC transporter permease subunit n=1 Tax=Pantoea ananas TaxID=553 RepID=UPI0027D7C486|nr:ABC transporter permease subunit [Pantoea ananatis]
MTIYITILSLLISTPLGLVFAAAKMCPFKIISWPVSVIINITRALPMIVVLFYIYFVFPRYRHYPDIVSGQRGRYRFLLFYLPRRDFSLGY